MRWCVLCTVVVVLFVCNAEVGGASRVSNWISHFFPSYNSRKIVLAEPPTKNFVFGTHHKTGTFFFTIFQRHLLNQFDAGSGRPQGDSNKFQASCRCEPARKGIQMCLDCHVNQQIANEVLDPKNSVRFIHSVRSPIQALVSQRGYQTRLRKVNPDRKLYDLVKADSEFYRAVDSGDETRIWYATFKTMRRDLDDMLAVMNKTEGASNVLHLNFDTLMDDVSSRVQPMLNHLFEPHKEPPTENRTAHRIKEWTPQLVDSLSLKQAVHVQASEEKKNWMKDLSHLVATYPQFRELAKMEAQYQKWWERNQKNALVI